MSDRLRLLAAVLMAISAATHVVQLVFFRVNLSVVVVALFGVAYLLISVGLFARARMAYWIGAVLPTIGGLLGIYRYLFIQPNAFSVINVLIDVVVVPSCVLLIKDGGRRGAL